MRRWIPLLLVMVALAACGKKNPDNPTVDATPTITTISPAPWAILTDSVIITVQAPQADSLCLAVDDEIVACDNSPPFELDWWTMTVTNGAHLLSVKAINAAGLIDSSFAVVVYNPSHGVAVAVRPLMVVLALGDTLRFEAIVLGATDTRVTWSVQVPGSGSDDQDYGHITQDGFYTAPVELPFPATAVIRAVSVAEPKRYGTAGASLVDGVAVEVTPASTEVLPGRTRQFAAQVHGTADQRVTWTVMEGAAHGSISTSGLYTAPEVVPTPATATIRAVSVADTTRSRTAAVTLLPVMDVTITPGEMSLHVLETFQFQAAVQNTTDQRVTWSVMEGAAHGSITNSGLYTAPDAVPTPAMASIRAVSVADTLRADTALVTILPAVPAPADSTALLDISWAGYRVAWLSHQAINVAAEALVRVQALNGGVAAFEGVLEGSGDSWTFTPGETRRGLRVLGAGVPEVDIYATTFESSYWPGWWSDPYYIFHGSLDCRLVVGSDIDLQISNRSWDPYNDPLSATAMICSAMRFSRAVTGHAAIGDLGTWQVNISHRGHTWGCSSAWSSQDSLSGSVTTSLASIQLNEAIGGGWGWDYIAPGTGSGFIVWSWSQDDVAQTASATFTLSDVYMCAWYDLYAWYSQGTVEYAGNWIARGAVLKDGQPYGQIRFSGPVVDGDAPGPNAILDCGGAGALVLRGRDLRGAGPAVIIPNPFHP